jgi:hypothetical protein
MTTYLLFMAWNTLREQGALTAAAFVGLAAKLAFAER